jgi:hypothetical protein
LNRRSQPAFDVDFDLGEADELAGIDRPNAENGMLLDIR